MPLIPEPGHQSWPQLPNASHVPGGPSGGAHGAVFAFDGEHKVSACAVPVADPRQATFRPLEAKAAIAIAAIWVRCMAGSFHAVSSRWHTSRASTTRPDGYRSQQMRDRPAHQRRHCGTLTGRRQGPTVTVVTN